MFSEVCQLSAFRGIDKQLIKQGIDDKLLGRLVIINVINDVDGRNIYFLHIRQFSFIQVGRDKIVISPCLCDAGYFSRNFLTNLFSLLGISVIDVLITFCTEPDIFFFVQINAGNRTLLSFRILFMQIEHQLEGISGFVQIENQPVFADFPQLLFPVGF